MRTKVVREKLKYILAVFIIVFVFGCDSGGILAPPEEAGLGYFPMQIGNQWRYAKTDDPQFVWEYKIVNKTQIGSYTYFVFERRFSQTSFVDSVFYRVGPAAKIYTYRNGRDVLYIDFGRPVGKRWDSYSEYDGIMQRKNFTVEVPAGKFNDCIEIFFDIPEAIDDENWETYAPEIGLVEINSAWFYGIKLQSAVVNGVSYP